MLLCSESWAQVLFVVSLVKIVTLYTNQQTAHTWPSEGPLSLPHSLSRSLPHFFCTALLFGAPLCPPKAFGAIRMGAGWIESIWIGFRFTPWVWYDMHPTGISRVGLFIWLFLKAANIERGKQVQMLIIPDVSIWVWLNHSTMLLHRTLFILPISLMWSSYLSRTGGALFTSWHALQVTANYVCVLHRVCVCVCGCYPAGGTSTAVRCVVVSSVPPSPVTSTAATAIDRTGRAAPSACVKVTELWYIAHITCCKMLGNIQIFWLKCDSSLGMITGAFTRHCDYHVGWGVYC